MCKLTHRLKIHENMPSCNGSYTQGINGYVMAILRIGNTVKKIRSSYLKVRIVIRKKKFLIGYKSTHTIS